MMLFRQIGIWGYGTLQSIGKFIPYIYAYLRFKTDMRTKKDERFSVSLRGLYPCLKDNTKNTGFDAHYIYHPAWAARIVSTTKPVEHVDVSSSLSFVTLVSAFLNVRFYDYRPAQITLPNLACGSADICALPFESGSVSSLSCMHVVEHIGLGRYGDPIDSQGDIKAINELKRVMVCGGDLLFVVPIGGTAMIVYNAHRIYAYDLVLNLFSGFNLENFSLVTDSGNFVSPATKEMADGCSYGCGCFWFKKIHGSK